MSAEFVLRVEPDRVHHLQSAVALCLRRRDQPRPRRRSQVAWSVPSYDPNELLVCFPSLSFSRGIRLAAYQLTEGGNANGLVFVVPEGRRVPEPAMMPWSFAAAQ
ncbi:MAG TPA: hypothetical protein VM537_04635 [Anaerolineae bacterium]|nr:hypothetical protein [Anaerolineae bacterium]